MQLLLLSAFGSCPPHKLFLFEGALGWRLWLLATKTTAWFGVTLCGTVHGSPVSRVHKTKSAPQTKCFRKSLAILLTFICQSYLLKKKKRPDKTKYFTNPHPEVHLIQQLLWPGCILLTAEKHQSTERQLLTRNWKPDETSYQFQGKVLLYNEKIRNRLIKSSELTLPARVNVTNLWIWC